MAKATANCTCKVCGKVFTVTRDVFKASQRESTIAYMVEHYTECPECYKARMAAKQAQEDAASGWAKLTGSEKQIAWATDIRKDMIDNQIMIRVAPQYIEQARRAVIALTERHTDARWWIDHRDDWRGVVTEFAAVAEGK